MNTEGRVQRTGKATFAPGEARRTTGRSCAPSPPLIDKPLPYDSLEALRARLEQVNPVFGRLGFLPRFGATDLTAPGGRPGGGERRGIRPRRFHDYYQTNPISRASAVMAECSATYAAPVLMAAE